MSAVSEFKVMSAGIHVRCREGARCEALHTASQLHSFYTVGSPARRHRRPCSSCGRVRIRRERRHADGGRVGGALFLGRERRSASRWPECTGRAAASACRRPGLHGGHRRRCARVRAAIRRSRRRSGGAPRRGGDGRDGAWGVGGVGRMVAVAAVIATGVRVARRDRAVHGRGCGLVDCLSRRRPASSHRFPSGAQRAGLWRQGGSPATQAAGARRAGAEGPSDCLSMAPSSLSNAGPLPLQAGRPYFHDQAFYKH